MIRSILTSLVATAVFALLPGCGPQQPVERTPGIKGLEDAFERDQLVIVTRDGARHSFEVYLALDFEQQRRGLMFVRELSEETGMLFVYDEPGVRSMWMKNTYISLDIVFAREDGTVSSVISDAEPLSLQSLRATEPVNYVLELKAGVARRLGIGAGSRLIWGRNGDNRQSKHGGDRIGQVVHVCCRDAGDIDTARVHHVDPVLFF